MLVDIVLELIIALGFISSIILYVWHYIIVIRSRLSRPYVKPSVQFGDGINGNITFIMPVRKEPLEYIAETARYIRSIGLRDYEIILVSDDEPSIKDSIIELIEKLRREGVNIWLLWRSDPRGFRTGALNDGLRLARCEYIYVVDVDSRPNKCFLLKAMDMIRRDNRVVAVVARWEALNKQTRISQALELALKYFVNILYKARSRIGFFTYPLGTGTLYSSRILKHEMHGWDENRIQDDMELGARLMQKGYSVVYIDECPVLVENPNTYKAFRIQQSRWSYGALDALVARARHIMSSPYPLIVKLDAILYLAQYVPPALLFIGSLLLPLLAFVHVMEPTYIRWLVSIWLIANALYGFILNLESGEKASLWFRIVQLGRLAAITTSASPYIARSTIKALFRIRESYKRTPKGVFEKAKESSRIPWELVFAVFFSTASFFLFKKGWLLASIWLLLNALCYIYVVVRFPRDVFFS